jgi:hypothetical protein
MPGGNFDVELNVRAGPSSVVDAGGPLDPAVSGVTIMCVWVFQREGEEDAVANAMGPPNGMSMPGMTGAPSQAPGTPGVLFVQDLGTKDARWDFGLNDRLKDVPFHAGSATALAIGVFTVKDGAGVGRQRVFQWTEPVRLKGPGAQA